MDCRGHAQGLDTAVEPTAFYIEHSEGQNAQHPANGIGQAESKYSMPLSHCQQNPQNAEQADTDTHDHRRRQRVASAAHSSGKNFDRNEDSIP